MSEASKIREHNEHNEHNEQRKQPVDTALLESGQHTDGGSRGRSVVLTSFSAAILFLLLRVLAVSDWNWRTAFAVTHTVNFDDSIGMVLGTLMANEAATGVLLSALLPLTVLTAVWPLSGERTGAGALLLAITTVAGALALVTTTRAWWVFVAAAVIAGLLVAARLLWRSGLGKRVIDRVFRRVGVTVVVAALILAAVVQTPWVPKERIVIADDEVTGYVLSEAPGFMKVLTESDREIMIVKLDEVSEREEFAH